MANFTRDQIRTGLSGPVIPLPTPFSADGRSVDHDALAKYVAFMCDNGARAVMTTVGTSRFNLLSEDEIQAVNATVANACGKDTICILAGPQVGGLDANIKWAQAAEVAGADAYIAFFPERWYGEEAIFDFFKTLSQSVDIGVMIHEMAMRSGYFGNAEQYPVDLLERLVALDGMVGMKEECMDADYAASIHQRLKDKCAIIGAGSMRNFLRDHPHGAKAYLVGVGNIFPKVANAFHAAVMAGDDDLARAIQAKYEAPYFDKAVALGWHVQLKEAMNIMGLMPAYERAPLPRLDEDKRAELKAHLQTLGWLDLDPAHEPEL